MGDVRYVSCLDRFKVPPDVIILWLHDDYEVLRIKPSTDPSVRHFGPHYKPPRIRASHVRIGADTHTYDRELRGDEHGLMVWVVVLWDQREDLAPEATAQRDELGVHPGPLAEGHDGLEAIDGLHLPVLEPIKQGPVRADGSL